MVYAAAGLDPGMSGRQRRAVPQRLRRAGTQARQMQSRHADAAPINGPKRPVCRGATPTG